MPAFHPIAPGLRRRQWLLMAAAAAGGLQAQGALAAYVVRPWPAGRPVPALDLDDLSGARWSLATQRGRVAVVNFWATWCEPCRAEMPSLQALAQRHAQDDLVVVAVNYQETVPAIRRFLQAQPLTLPILLDRDGAAAAAWTPRVFPCTVLIDRTGQPRQVVLGELDWTGAVAAGLLEPLLQRVRS